MRTGGSGKGRPAAALAALGLALCCAGPLDDPERFLYLLADGGVADAATDDAGTDAGTLDAGAPDAGTPDAGTPDAGSPDSGTPDAGAPDAGHADAGAPDAGHADAGAPDAGHPDAGHPDAGCNPGAILFGPTCATALCHGAETQQANLDLESPGLPGRLVGKQGYGGPGLVIDPDHPDSSLILTKLSADPPFNFQMPLGLDPLTPAEVACLRDWVHAAVGK